MKYARSSHTASVLKNGKVLVAGGIEYDASNSAELYDPSTGAWTTTGNMTYGRYDTTAVVLKNGKVLVTDGAVNDVRNDTELYDPLTGTWKTTDNMNTLRVLHKQLHYKTEKF